MALRVEGKSYMKATCKSWHPKRALCQPHRQDCGLRPPLHSPLPVLHATKGGGEDPLPPTLPSWSPSPRLDPSPDRATGAAPPSSVIRWVPLGGAAGGPGSDPIDDPTSSAVPFSPSSAPVGLQVRQLCDWRAAAALLEAHGASLSASHLCALVHRVARLAAPGAPRAPRSAADQQALASVLTAAESELLAAMDGATPGGLAAVLWDFARLHHAPSPEFLQTWFFATMPLLPSGTPSELSSALWALAALGCAPPREWTQRWLDATEGQLAVAQISDLTNTAWALAKLDAAPAKPWLQQWEAAFEVKLEEAAPNELSNALWAVAMLRHVPARGWLRAVLQALVRLQGQSTAQQLSNVLWALARLARDDGVEGGPPLQAWGAPLVAALGARLETADRVTLSNALWALAALNWPPPRTWIRRWSAAFAASLDTLPGPVSNPGSSPGPSPASAGPTVPSAASAAAAAQLVNALWALATLRQAPGTRWTQGCAVALEPLLESASLDQLCTALWALVCLGAPRPDARWLQRWQAAVAARNPQPGDQDCMRRALWALAVWGGPLPRDAVEQCLERHVSATAAAKATHLNGLDQPLEGKVLRKLPPPDPVPPGFLWLLGRTCAEPVPSASGLGSAPGPRLVPGPGQDIDQQFAGLSRSSGAVRAVKGVVAAQLALGSAGVGTGHLLEALRSGELDLGPEPGLTSWGPQTLFVGAMLQNKPVSVEWMQRRLVEFAQELQQEDEALQPPGTLITMLVQPLQNIGADLLRHLKGGQ